MTDQQGWGPPQQQQPSWDSNGWGRPPEQEGRGLPPQPRHGQSRGPQVRMQPSTGYSYQPQQQGYPPMGPGPQWPKKRHTVRNVILGAVGGIVLIIVIAAVASAHNDGVSKTGNPPAASASTKPSTSASQQPADNSTTGPVGSTFTVTDTNQNGATVKYSVTLDRVIQHAAPDNSFDTAPAGDHLAAAEFTIKGLVGDDQDDANNNASVIGTNSQTYNTGIEGVAAGTNFSNGQYNTSPGSVSIGWVSFEVKDGVHVASVQWSPDSGMSGETPATWTVRK
jgi:hypothetical protein